MNIFLKRWCSAVLILLSAACTNLPAATGDIRITSVEFGLFENFKVKNPVLTKTSHVPWRVGQEYGWKIGVDTKAKSVFVHEEFILPRAPEQWIGEEDTLVSSLFEEGNVAVNDREIIPEEGYLYGAWTTIAGDPKGSHLLRVFIDGKLAATFKFSIE